MLFSVHQEVKSIQVVADIDKRSVHKDESKKGKPIEYAISILHRKPEFGKDIRFQSTYYAKESKDTLAIKKDFAKAFRLAHPSWLIEDIIVEPVT